ncbi:MAG TPA: hypothetical protein VFA27_05105 [Vicinamibacterales bacterium]|nr:hypothetical protein [Vicinamibacterales bacterium]
MTTIYKYLPQRYAEAFILRGEVLFRSIPYFLACEDARRDELEGTHQYAPGGLDITNHTRGFTSRLPGSSMQSSVKHPDQVFIFCASLVLKPELATKFSADACIQIANAEMLAARLRAVLRRTPRVKMRTFRARPVKYYETANPPGATWALPDEIIMHKRQQLFGDEEEYRFAFSLKRHVFDFENANYTIASARPAPAVVKGSYPEMLVRVGPMTDCCRPFTFDQAAGFREAQT